MGNPARFGPALGATARMGDNYSDRQYGSHRVVPRPDPNGRVLMASGALGKINRQAMSLGDASTGTADDISGVIAVSDWVNGDTWDIDKAKGMYTMAQIYLTTREKLAYIAYVGSSVSKDVQLYQAVAAAPGGLDFLKTALAAANTLQNFDKPNVLQSFLNATTAFETIIFPSLGVEVRGMVAQFNGTDFAASRIGNTGASSKTIYDFGDLTQTPVQADMDALALMQQNIKARYQLGLAFLPLLGAILAFLTVVTILVGAVVKMFKSQSPTDILNDDNVQKYLNSLPPAQAQKETHDILFGGALLNQNRTSDLFGMLLALGGVLTGGAILYWIFKS